MKNIDRIRNYIVSRREQGELMPGDRLPSYKSMMEMFGISYLTVSSIINKLAEEGLVETRRGQGSYIAGSGSLRVLVNIHPTTISFADMRKLLNKYLVNASLHLDFDIQAVEDLGNRQTQRRFWFFTLHTDHRGVQAQVESCRLAVSKIREMCGSEPVILTGDFNVAQDDETYALIAESGVLNDAYEVAEFRFAPTGTFNAFKPENWTSKRIDHIWVSDRARVLRYGVLTYHYWEGERGSERTLEDFPKEAKAEKRTLRLPSDHYPVNAVIEFPKCGKR